MASPVRVLRRLAAPLALAISAALAPAARAADPHASGAVMQFGPAIHGHWCGVLARVNNPTNAPLDALLVNNFNGHANLQFGVRAWVPPHALRTVNAMLHVPEHTETTAGGHGMGIDTLLLSGSGGNERRYSEDQSILLTNELPIHTALLDQSNDDNDPIPILLSDMLKQQISSTAVTSSNPDRLPDTSTGFDPMDLIMVAQTNVLPDAAQRLAMRQWICAGGHLVIFTTLADPRFGAALLGEQWQVAQVETVHADRFALVSGNNHHNVTCDPDGALVRIIAANFVPSMTTGGWPVVMRESVGRGDVTLVNASANLFMQGNKLNDAGAELAYLIIPARGVAPSADLPEAIRTLNAGQVAYQIVARSTVAIVLGLMIAVLAAAGIVLWVRRRLEWIAPVGAGAAVLASGALVVLGSAHVLPLTLTSAAIATVVPDQGQLLIRGQAEMFSPAAQDAALRSANGPALWPNLTTQREQLARLVRTDWNTYQWEHLTLPAGAALQADVAAAIALPQPPRVSGTFTERGLAITVNPGDIGALRDPVVAGPDGNTALSPAGSGQFIIADHDLLPPDTFVEGTLLDQEQQARQNVYRGIFNGAPRPERASFYGWSNAPRLAAGGATLDGAKQQRQATLLELPIAFTRTPAHTVVAIPAAFIRMTAARSPHAMATTAFNTMTQQFVPDLGLGATLTMRFAIPSSVLPLHIIHAVLHVAMRAQNRDIDISAAGDSSMPINHRTNASAPFDVPLPDVQPDATGGIDVTIHVADAPTDDFTNTWEIHSLRLSVDGETQ